MSKPILRVLSQENPLAASERAGTTCRPPSASCRCGDDTRTQDRAASAWLRTRPAAPSRIGNMEPCTTSFEPMADHVVMTFPAGSARFERRNGKSVAMGTTRSGVVMIIPAGSSSRWDIFQPLNVVHLYLPHTTLQRIAREADMAAPGELLERTAHPDPITSRLLMSAAEVLEGNAALDALFRQQLTDLLATRLLAAHAGSPATFRPLLGGLSPTVLRRAIERLRSDGEADVSLAALASDAGLSRFHFCRAFKESTGLSPHAWLRQYQLEQAMNMLRDTDESVASIAAALGYASQTAFAAAFRKLTGETPSDWRRRAR